MPESAPPKVAVVTGSNTGIGKETAVGLAALGMTTVMACRNQPKAEAAAAEVRDRSGNDDVHVVALDLADLGSVAACAQAILAGWDRLDVLVNNAGGVWSERQETAQGFEQTFGVNHLGPFYLTALLLDRLKASAPSRVVNLASVGHHFATGGLSFADLQSERKYAAMDAYAKSKLANVLFTRGLSTRLEGSGVTATCCHPGPVRSGFGMDGDLGGLMGFGNRLIRPFEISSAAGARTSIYLAASPEVEGESGGYYARRKPGHLSRNARSDAAVEQLWSASEQLVDAAGFAVAR
jgi:NAD(P)-dependent dehydrogenase (short-subunit alcohol dehydrogenase family)